MSNAAAYGASKGGLSLFTMALALGLAPYGVRCNAVSPGDIETPMLRFQAERYGNGDPQAYHRELPAKYPQGDQARFIQPEEVAELAFFLCQPDARSSLASTWRSIRGCHPVIERPVLCSDAGYAAAHPSCAVAPAQQPTRRRLHRHCHD